MMSDLSLEEYLSQVFGGKQHILMLQELLQILCGRRGLMPVMVLL